MAVTGQSLEGGGDALLVAHDVIGGDGELVTNLQVDLSVRGAFSLLENTGTNLGALEVGKGSNVEIQLVGDGADEIQAILVLLVGAMAHVETGDVHARFHELLHAVVRVNSWSEGIYNLGSTHASTL